MPPKKTRNLPKKKISSPEEGWTVPEKPVKKKIVKRRSSSSSPKRTKSPSPSRSRSKTRKRPSSPSRKSSSPSRKSSSPSRKSRKSSSPSRTSSPKRKSSALSKSSKVYAKKKRASSVKPPREDTVEFSRFAPYFLRPQVKKRKAKAKAKTKYVQVAADDEGMPIYADLDEEQLIAKWLAANDEERRKMIIGETEDGEPIYGDALDDDSDDSVDEQDEHIERKRARMLAKLRKLLPYEEDIEFEYEMVDLYTDGGLELAQQLGLPLKEQRLLPRKVRRYVVDAERAPPVETYKMTKGPGGLLYDLKGVYTMKRLGSDFVKDDEELDIEEKALAPQKNRTAYAHFAHERRDVISRNEPALSTSEVSKRIKEEWGALDEDEKAVYTKIAEDDEKRYKKEKKNFDILKRKKYEKVQPRTPHDEKAEQRQRKADFIARNANKYNKKFPRYTKVSFLTKDNVREEGVVVDFAKPGFAARTKSGAIHKLKYTNPSVVILKPVKAAPTAAGGYRLNPAEISIDDIYKTHVPRKVGKNSLRAHVIQTYVDILGEKARDQIAKFEKAVFEKVLRSSKSNVSTYTYLINVLVPLVFLDGSLAEYAKIFKAKIANGSYEFGMLADANMAIYLPEFAMTDSFSKNVKTGAKGQHGQAIDVAGEVISEILHIQIENVLDLYLRVLDPTRQKKMHVAPDTFHIIQPLVDLLEEPAEICQKQTGTGVRQKVDANNKLVYETQGSGKNKKKVPVYEKIPDGDIVMCFDDRKKKFSCQSVNDVIEAIRYADRMSSQGDIIVYPTNKSTGEIYPDDFIERFRKTYASAISEYKSPAEPSPRPFTPSPVRKARSPAKIARKALPPRHKRNASPSRKVKEITAMGLIGNHLDVISLFTNTIDVPLKSGQILQIPVFYDLKNNDINVVVASFDVLAENPVDDLVKTVEKIRKTLKKVDLYIIGVGSIGDSKKKSIRKEISKVLVDRNAPKHVFFSENDEEHLMDALFNVIVDVEGVEILDSTAKEKAVEKNQVRYDPKRVNENYVPYFDGHVWIYSKEEEIKSEKARKARIEKITLKHGQKPIGKKTIRAEGRSKKIVRKASFVY